MVKIRGRIVTADRIIEDGVIVAEDGVITGVIDASGPKSAREEEALRSTPSQGTTILPGLVDVHCHGGGGASFPNAGTREEAMTAVLEHRRHGTTSLVASLVTASRDVLRERSALLAELADEGELAGIHFEGPFISFERCGAQDPAYIIDPDPEFTRELLGICRGHALTMTLAPEKQGAYGPGSVAEALVEGGALPSWGHTDSGSLHAREALEYSREVLDRTKGRRSANATITHLFNGMRPLHHRDTGPIAEFLSDATRGGAIAEMICDGVHLDPSLVRDVVEILGRDACVLVTDAMEAAGMPDGEYVLGSQKVSVEDGRALISGQGTLAGGTAHLLDCVRAAVGAGIGLVDAVYMSSVQGARILGRADIGCIEAGRRADLLEVDEGLRPIRVYKDGALIR